MSQVEALAPDVADSAESVATEEITVCICTYRRLELLERLLVAVAAQRTDGLFRYSCVIVDNDASESARELVERLQLTFPVPIRYAVEPARNFALVRNRAVGMATGNLFAFIDDDEVPNEDWLLQMLGLLHRTGADAVLGPVRPYFENEPPSWIVRSRICERAAHPTGMALHWRQTRTGNVLLRAALINEDGIRFDPAYASGGKMWTSSVGLPRRARSSCGARTRRCMSLCRSRVSAAVITSSGRCCRAEFPPAIRSRRILPGKNRGRRESFGCCSELHGRPARALSLWRSHWNDVSH